MCVALGRWTISDVFEEGWLGGAPFYGGYGLLTVNGVAKPAYRAFEMLNTAGDQRLPVKIIGQEHSPTPDATPVTVFATTHSAGSTVGAKGLQIFASNFWCVWVCSGAPQCNGALRATVPCQAPPCQAPPCQAPPCTAHPPLK